MPRARTRGDRIQVQLPLDVDASVRSRALADSTSPSQVIVNIVAGVCRKVAPIRPPIVERPVDHKHLKKTLNGAGMPVCPCGAVFINDEWRVS